MLPEGQGRAADGQNACAVKIRVRRFLGHFV
jgi:hypothetical protein